MPEQRLQKILSQAGVASRRKSEELIVDGRVTINGTTVLKLGTKADAIRDALADAGIILEDGQDGTNWRRS